ncbi:hypothetical protein MFRU_011g01270 [Monilinia fructicola]|nr:hypothetical protein MFRU_011g01270 [Monilinia fructicola]
MERHVWFLGLAWALLLEFGWIRVGRSTSVGGASRRTTFVMGSSMLDSDDHIDGGDNIVHLPKEGFCIIICHSHSHSHSNPCSLTTSVRNPRVAGWTLFFASSIPNARIQLEVHHQDVMLKFLMKILILIFPLPNPPPRWPQATLLHYLHLYPSSDYRFLLPSPRSTLLLNGSSVSIEPP